MVQMNKNSIVSETIILETQALIANSMQALDEQDNAFAQICMERAFNNLTKLLGDK
jgi:hypothetical protein